MANYILDEVYACTLWDHLQQNLFTAQKLKEMAREHCWQATIKWERFKMRKFNIWMVGIIEREWEVMKRFEEEGSIVEEERPPPPLIIWNPTPPHILTPAPPPVVWLPGYRPPPPPEDAHNQIIIVKSSSGTSSSDYETAPKSRHMTPEEWKKQRWWWRQIEQTFRWAHENEIQNIRWIWEIQSWIGGNVTNAKFSFLQTIFLIHT